MLKKIVLAAIFIGTPAALFADPEPAAKPVAKPRFDNYGDPLPEEALARFSTTRFRQGFCINDIRYSPDGKAIAIASDGRALGLWDVASGKELFQFDDKSGDPPCAGSIAFSPDGKVLAAAHQQKIKLWNTRTGELIKELRHTSYITTLVFASDGKTVISGARDHIIRFWDMATGLETAQLREHTGANLPVIATFSLALSSDGKQLASGGHDKVIRIWDIQKREVLIELRRECIDRIDALSFSPDGKQLVSVNCWGSGPCIVWDIAKREAAYKLDEDATVQAAFSPNGKWLATGCKDGSIHLHDSATGKEVRCWKTQSLHFLGLVFSKDSKVIASSSFIESAVRFWEVETGKDIHPLDVHYGPIGDIQLSEDGKSLWVQGEADQRIIRWNTATAEPEEVISIPSSYPLTRGRLSPGGRLAAWYEDKDTTVHLMDLKTRKEACEPLKVEPFPSYVRFSPDSKVIAVGITSGFYMWKWQSENNPKLLQSPDLANRIQSFTPDSKYLITDNIHMWEVETGKKVCTIPGNELCTAFAISPDGKWAAFAKPDDVPCVKVIDLDRRKKLHELNVSTSTAYALAFSPDGCVLVFGENGDHSQSGVKLIEFSTGQTIATYRGHHSGVYGLQFSTDGRSLYSGGGDSTILKWDATARHGKGLSTPNLQTAWLALDDEASKAYPAHWDFVDAPKEAIAVLRKKMIPEKMAIREYHQLVEDLNADAFRKREKATESLRSAGYAVEGMILKSLGEEKRLEVRERLQKVIDKINGDSFIQMQRAMRILETINNEESRKILRELAEGEAESMITKEAKALLKTPRR